MPGLRQKLRQLLVRTAAWPLAVLLALALAVLVMTVQELQAARLGGEARALAHLLQSTITQRLAALQQRADEHVGASCDHLACRQTLLARMLQDHPEAESALLVDGEGHLLAAWTRPPVTAPAIGTLVGRTAGDRDAFDHTRGSGKPQLSDMRRPGRGVSFALTVPLLTPSKGVQGALQLELAPSALFPPLEQALTGLKPDDAVQILDRSGAPLASVRHGRVSGPGTPNGPEPSESSPWVTTGEAALAEGWRVVASRPLPASLQEVAAEAALLAIAALGLIAVAGAGLLRASRGLAQPFERLAEDIRKVEIGHREGIRFAPLPRGTVAEALAVRAALEESMRRADAALLGERRSADALDTANRKLAHEIDTRDTYLEKQTRRLQEAMSAAWQASEAKSRMLTNTSHEIRTPLNGIIGTTELLLRSQPLSESQRSLLRTQLGAAEALRVLVDDILHLGRASSGLALQPAPFDVAAEAHMVCGALQPLADSRQITLRVEVPRELHACRVGDRARIRQIMMGLVGNALKFTERGEVVLALDDSEDYELLIRVRDTGIGIPADQFSRIFDPFYQIESSTSRRFPGTGLGLAIIDEIVKAMDGRITVESTLGAGSTFCVCLPLELADASELAATETGTTTLSVPAGLRVLVVDDIEMNRELLEMQVASMGAASASAESGQRALDLLAEADFDLVLLDCQMPEMDGYEAAREIRGRWPDRPLRIVAVTAHAEPGERERCLRAGMDDYVSKPLSMDTLARVLGEASRAEAPP